MHQMLSFSVSNIRSLENYINRAIRSLFHLFALHLTPAVSALQLLKFGIHSLQLFECLPALTLSVATSRLITYSRPSNPLNAFLLAPQMRLLLTIVRVYKLYLLT